MSRRRSGVALFLAAFALVVAPAVARAGQDDTGTPPVLVHLRMVVVPRDGGWSGMILADFRNPGPGRVDRLVVPLPDAARQVEVVLGGSETPGELQPEGGALVDRRGLEAGAGRQIGVAVSLPPGDANLSLAFPAGVGRFDLAVPQGAEVEAPRLVNQGLFELEGIRFELYQTPGTVPPGTSLSVQVRAPAPGPADPTNPAGGLSEAPPLAPGEREIAHAHGGNPLKVAINFAFIVVAFAAAVVGTRRSGRRLLARAGVSRP
ncbi:hypothetical protein [Caldinitratiruptor microaerophilus]|uniref:Uncharacterized protein n=1 Tax=Caldinitratiruptor microaerophilus TaxID=671077 RepID=A0AA35GAB8_9FIRM|nr:hypothetical protein [Caldinitratiruptor microaerophilus]BDG61129.1 hypothetical protein caldi_22190 [Caldinitratiruptor microaerophilus]